MKRHRNFLIVEGTRRGVSLEGTRRGGLSGLGGGGGLVVLPLENFQIQDVCRSDSYEFWGHFFLLKTSLFYKHAIFSCFENKLILQA